MWPFPSKRFPGDTLVGIGSIGIDANERIVAFGDFNGDQFLDILSLSPDQQALSLYLWNHVRFAYEKAPAPRHPSRIFNVVPGDFTHDGTLDVLVMSESHTYGLLDLYLYKGFPGGGFDSSPLSLPPSTYAQPIPVDTNGDMKIDLLAMTEASASDPSMPLMIWKNVWNASQPDSPLFDLASVEPRFTGTPCALSNPHSNAVIDLNGDCLADIFLVCDDGNGIKSYQIWINNKDAGFSLAHHGPLPSGIQSISFADMDRDGTIDLVFSTCSAVSSATGLGTNCSINIAYNKQLPLCTSHGPQGRRCRPPNKLCTADPNFSFDLTPRTDNLDFFQIPISTIFPSPPGSSPAQLLVFDTTFSTHIPLSLKLGDVNLDGFPDLLVIIAPPNSPHDRVPKLIYSVPCAKGVVGCANENSGKRGFSVATKGTDALDQVKDARGISFLDLDEDGTLDMLIQRTGSAGHGTIMFVQNNFYFDAFFLKAIVLNGACDSGWCETPNNSQRYQPLGVSYSGATCKYTVLDTSGSRSAAQVGQLPQTSYHSLFTPYSFFGLGRTNNYIENLFIGSTKHTEPHFINIEGVIPNSRVVILPPAGHGYVAWKRELFLRPGEWIPWVTLTVLLGTAILAIIVLVLHLKEKREDELERRKASHHINFDAL